MEGVDDIREIMYDASEMHKVDGEREGSFIFFLNGYRYRRDIRKKGLSEEVNERRLYCKYRGRSKKNCSAKVEVMGNTKLKMTGDHYCDKDENFLEEQQMYHTMQHEAVITPKDPHRILNETCIKFVHLPLKTGLNLLN